MKNRELVHQINVLITELLIRELDLSDTGTLAIEQLRAVRDAVEDAIEEGVE